MAFTGKQLAADRLTNSAATYYTVGTGIYTKITAFTLTNTGASSNEVTIHLVPSGGSASDDNIIMDAVSIGAGESRVVYEGIGHFLDAGDTIQGFASTTEEVAIVVSGVEAN